MVPPVCSHQSLLSPQSSGGWGGSAEKTRRVCPTMAARLFFHRRHQMGNVGKRTESVRP
ncbi:hypothetical protein FAGKG844_190028 [Frankia sp. AgKG'84/4]